MGLFDDNDLAAMIDAFDSTTVTIRLNGAKLKDITARFKTNQEFSGQAGEIRILPALTARVSDFAGVDRKATLMVNGVEYRQAGPRVPSDSGFVRIGLVK